jgi:WD40 repeat protein
VPWSAGEPERARRAGGSTIVRTKLTPGSHEGLAETQPAASSWVDPAADPARSMEDAAAPPPGEPGPRPADPSGPSPADPTRTSQPDRHAGPLLGALSPAIAPQLRDHQRYDILGEHGRGGLGRVSRAHDRELGRDIAIKELISRGHVSEVRFLREALITARLQHPGIVPVYEAGRWPDGTPFYAMKLVSGRPLRDLIAERGTVDERIGLLHHVIAVADAIAYAHGKRIIHRDLKPANVIVGEFGETIVIDWGLAKDLTVAEEPAIGGGPFRAHRDDDLTAAGSVLGTPAYMAPEQARAEPVDQRADVFAIGAMLWELSSLHKLPPHASGQRGRLLRSSGIDPDLITIIEKALDPEPAHRYPDAGALAADLKAFKAGARIAARRYSPWALLTHWIRRHRALALSIATALALAGMAARLYIRSVTAERDRADAALQDTATAKDALLLEHAELLLRGDPTAALGAMAGYRGTDTARARRVLAEARGRGVARIINAHSDTIRLLAGLPDGAILSVGEDRRIALTRGETISTLAHDVAVPVIAAYSQARGVLAYSNMDSGVTLLDPTTGRTTQLPKIIPRTLEFSDDGARIAIFDKELTLTVWSTESQPHLLWRRVFPRLSTPTFIGQDRILVSDLTEYTLASLRDAPDVVLSTPSTSFDASPEHLVVGDEHGNIRVYALPGLDLLGSTSACRDRVGDLRLVPQESAIIFTCHEGSAGVAGYRPALTIRERFATQGEASTISSSEDGHLAVILSASNIAYVHSLQSHLTYRYEGQANLACVAGPLSSNSHILTGDITGTIRSWDAPASHAHIAMRSEAPVIMTMVSPDGQLLAAGDASGAISVLRLQDGTLRTNRGHASLVQGLRFTAEGLLLSYGPDGRVLVWRMEDLSIIRRFEEHHARVEGIALIDHDRLVLSIGDDGRLLRWSPHDAETITLFKTRLPLVKLAALATDDTVVVADSSGSVWHVRSRDVAHQIRSPDGNRISLLRASPDGRLVAVGTERGDVTIYESTTWKASRSLKMNGIIRQVAFTADGSQIVVASERGSVQLVPLGPAARARWQEAHMDARDLVFSRDDQYLAIVCSDGTIWFYSFADDRWVFTRDHLAFTSFGRFSPDGRLFVSSDNGGAVVVRDIAATMRH